MRRFPRLRIREDLIGALVYRRSHVVEGSAAVGVYMGRHVRNGISSALILVDGELRSFDPREWVVPSFENP